MKELIACCGLDCERCDAMIATLNDDNILHEKTAKLWSELNGIKITAQMINCVGCRVDGVKTPFCSNYCQIRKYSRDKGFETCGNCPNIETCQTVRIVISNNTEAADNLRKSST